MIISQGEKNTIEEMVENRSSSGSTAAGIANFCSHRRGQAAASKKITNGI